MDRKKMNARQNKWKAENQDRIYLNVPKGYKDKWTQEAKAEGLSLTEYIIRKVEGDK